jgi:hypothetical protein
MEIMSIEVTVCGVKENREQESLFPTEQVLVTWLEGLQKACNLALQVNLECEARIANTATSCFYPGRRWDTRDNRG